MNNENLKAILFDMLAQLEDLRAEQLVTTVRLSAAMSLPPTDEDMASWKKEALDKNRAGYEVFRQAIAEIPS